MSAPLDDTQLKAMRAGELYDGSDPLLVRMRQDARRLLAQLAACDPADPDARDAITRRLLGGCGEKVYIEPPFYCDYGAHIFVGENFYANANCVILDPGDVRIGSNVFLGPAVQIYTASHPINAVQRNAGPEYGFAVAIGDNVWIGGASVINPGVTIGSNVVIGSGSVVTRDIPANVVAAGNPCRVIRELEPLS